eukprot:scpid74152/ scgid32972/ Dual serine/threonine and tyrosine protein kinase; Dusty protein kinase; Receptor-interacting serine/threonine-protein kinase 5
MATSGMDTRASTVAADVRKFVDQSRIVREVHQDTVDVFEKMKSFSNRSVSDTAVLTDEQSSAIQSVFEQSPTIIVLGRKELRRPILNFLAGEEVFPSALDEDLGGEWRTVVLKSGKQASVRLVYSDDEMADSYEITESDPVEQSASHATAPSSPRLSVRDVLVESGNKALSDVHVEVTLTTEVFESGLVVVSCATHDGYATGCIAECIKGRLPFFVFPIDLAASLTQEERSMLDFIRVRCPQCPVLFVGASVNANVLSPSSPPIRPAATVGMPSSATLATSTPATTAAYQSQISREATPVHEILIKHGFFSDPTAAATPDPDGAQSLIGATAAVAAAAAAATTAAAAITAATTANGGSGVHPLSGSVPPPDLSRFQPSHRFCEDPDDLTSQFGLFMSVNLSYWLLRAAACLHRLHIDCLTSFIHVAFEMSRDVLLTPQRIRYVRTQEHRLFSSLMDVAGSKQDELRRMMDEMLETLSPQLRQEATTFEFTGVDIPADCVVRDSKTLRICHSQIKAFVFEKLSSYVATQISSSVNGLKESLLGTLKRCLQSLEEHIMSDEALAAGSDDWALVSHEGEIIADPEENAAASATSKSALTMTSSTTAALHELLSTVYHLEFNERITQSGLQVLLDRLKNTLRFIPWKSSVAVDEAWRRSVADKQVESLSASRLAKTICAQFRSNLVRAHDRFTLALRELEVLHSARLQETDEARGELRKRFAPHVARLALHSTSLSDLIRHGMPRVGHELGRGQYGVVYTCQAWANKRPVCVKSVVPPDEKHWNDLALEFHYMWSLPDHPRIVTLHGSVVDYSYGGGDTPAVLLILERMQRDLHSGIRSGLSWAKRLVVACDVIEGIRFLHSQGLIHRDIKLKNVLLDETDRAKLTDLGFCKPEAMMTCSVVGTPIHMAPELFSGTYSVSVDVYAFGILFWYI